MLNSIQWTNTRILDRPSLAWWNESLWAGYLDLSGLVQVASIDVSLDPAPVMASTLPITSTLGPALTGFRPRLVVAVADPGVSVSIFSSFDGKTFAATVVLPFPAINQPALTAGNDLWLAWVDTNRQLHLAWSQDAVTFDDTTATVTVAGPPALASLVEEGATPSIAVAWREGVADDVTVSVFPEDAFDDKLPLRRSLGESGGVKAVGLAYAAGHKDSHRRLIVGCERFDPPRNHARNHHLFAGRCRAT